MAQKPPHNPSLRELAVNLESKGSDEIHHDIVIVPRVEADVSPRFSYSADYIQGLVTAERCDLMATTFSISVNRRQNSYESVRPPTAGCR